MVSNHGTDLPAVGVDVRLTVDDDIGIIGLDIGCDGTCPEMGMVAQDAVSDIVEVAELNVVEHDCVSDLHRASDGAPGTDENSVSDKRTMKHVGSGADDHRAYQKCGIQDFCGLVNPDVLCDMVILFRVQRGSDLLYES